MLKKLLKIARGFIWFIVILLLSLNAFILLSGRFYLYKGIYSTYLQGKSSPTIYDQDKFYSSTMPASEGKAWKSFKTATSSNYQPLEEYAKNHKDESFLVIKNGVIIYEKYFNNHSKETYSNSFSAAKTAVSILVGIALDEGKIKSLDEPVWHYLPQFKDLGREKITIRHLLTMSSGLDWVESGRNPLSENAESYYGTDLWGLVHRQQVERKPGEIFLYQSGNSQLLAFILEKATKMDLSKYANEKLWKKINAESDIFWSLDKENGAEKAFCCLYATTRDFARIGELFVHKGKWGETQIVSEKYFNEMIRNEPMKTEEGVPNTRYALHVWTYHEKGKTIVYCRGIKGQYIIAVPEENLVIVRTGQKRVKDVSVSDFKGKLSKEQAEKVGHPRDLFTYLTFGRQIVTLSSLKIDKLPN